MNRGWIQFLLVAVPVLSLIGAWLTLRAVDARRSDKEHQDKVEQR